MKMRSVSVRRFVFTSVASCVAAAACFAAGPRTASAQQEAAAPAMPSPEQEAAFKEMLDGATLVGHFTVTGRSTADLKEERYDLHSVEKAREGQWTFRTQIRYGDHNLTVPLTLPVKWAGDTPMIVVDRLQIPTLGTFDARVMFFKGHYAGYWSHGEHGGHLFGVIQHGNDDNEDESTENGAGRGEEGN